MSQPFSGGIAFPHDVENKAATSALPIENFTPARLVIPLRQGFGAACVPVVDVGQTVKKGQLVGRPSEDGGTPVHCGISGTVRALSPMPVIGASRWRTTASIRRKPPCPGTTRRRGLFA